MSNYIELFNKIIEENESNHLDFKQEFHKDNVNLIHDILCLANSPHGGNRYIVYGVSDKKELVGITGERKITQADLIQLLRGCGLNRDLHNHIQLRDVFLDGNIFYILEIEDVPYKPFFLTQSYPKKNHSKQLQPGSIFTRNSDRNTPIDSTASDDEVEIMWRQRFCLDQPPLKRFEKYLDDIENWEAANSSTGYSEYYYKPFPEFRIVPNENTRDIGNRPPKNDMWIPKTWKLEGRRIDSQSYSLKYFNMELKSICLWIGDNGREPIPIPYITNKNQDLKNEKLDDFVWTLSKTSLRFKVGLIIARLSYNKHLDDLLTKTKISLLD